MLSISGPEQAKDWFSRSLHPTSCAAHPGSLFDFKSDHRIAETTPGPLILVVQFVGFMGAFREPGLLHPLVAGTLAAVLTTWVTFVPCFLWIFLGAPWTEMLRGNTAVSGALAAVTAAVVGVILNLAIWFAIHTVFAEVREIRYGPLRLEFPVWSSVSWAALGLTVAAGVATFRFKIGMVMLLTACAGAGLLLYLAIGMTNQL